MTGAPPVVRPAVSVQRLLVFFATVYAIQGLAEPESGLATQPIFFLLKDEMRLSASEAATFLVLVGLAWSVKPLYGLVSDRVPFLGYRHPRARERGVCLVHFADHSAMSRSRQLPRSGPAARPDPRPRHGAHGRRAGRDRPRRSAVGLQP